MPLDSGGSLLGHKERALRGNSPTGGLNEEKAAKTSVNITVIYIFSNVLLFHLPFADNTFNRQSYTPIFQLQNAASNILSSSKKSSLS